MATTVSIYTRLAMKQRGLISSGKGRDPLTIVWRLKK